MEQVEERSPERETANDDGREATLPPGIMKMGDPIGARREDRPAEPTGDEFHFGGTFGSRFARDAAYEEAADQSDCAKPRSTSGEN